MSERKRSTTENSRSLKTSTGGKETQRKILKEENFIEEFEKRRLVEIIKKIVEDVERCQLYEMEHSTRMGKMGKFVDKFEKQ